MQTILKEITDLKLAEPKHRKAFWNWMGRSQAMAYAEAAFVLCSWDYIYAADDKKGEAFTKVFLRTGSPLEINLGGRDRSKAVSMLGAHALTLKSFGNEKLAQEVTQFAQHDGKTLNTGVRGGGAANYNLYTQFIDHCERTRYNQKTREAVGAMGNGGLPAAKAESFATSEAVDELTPYWGKDGLKRLGITG